MSSLGIGWLTCLILCLFSIIGWIPAAVCGRKFWHKFSIGAILVFFFAFIALIIADRVIS
jgi:Na+/H+ antiporter NhaB